MLRESEEVWGIWPRDDRYEVSTLGSVRSYAVRGKNPNQTRRRDTPRPIKLATSCWGYRMAWIGGKNTYVSVHRMVLETFRGIPEKKMCALHMNDIRDDNRLENLRWGTYKENMADRTKNGNTARGERQGMAKFSELDVIEMRYLRHTVGATKRAISLLFDTTPATVKDIVTGRSWRHVEHI